jgi:hypothetical protein
LIWVNPLRAQWFKLPTMANVDTTVWLKNAEQGCGHCVPSVGGHICVGDYGQPCQHPALDGDPMLLRRVLLALRAVADDHGNLVDAQRIRTLHASEGEVELTLALPAGCGPATVLVDDAFQVLRRLLPDTDIFVRPVG